MNYKQIVLIFNTPALNTDIQTYSLDELFDLGFKVCVIDASPVLNPLVNQIVTAKRLNDPRFDIYSCKTKKELELLIKDNAKTSCFIPMFIVSYDSKFVYKLFTKYNVFYGRITPARTEICITFQGISYKKTFKNSKLNPKHLYKAFYNRTVGKLIKCKQPNFIVLGGKYRENLVLKNNLCGNNTKVLKLHTWDNERFLRFEPYNNSKPYCVFLDEYFPFHPDNISSGIIPMKEMIEKYVFDMNQVFNHIRKNYHLDVIMAAHPRADYSDKKELYPNMKIEYGKTAQLVKGASLVVANCSNSMFFAVMANIPIIIVNSSAIKDNDDYEEQTLLYFAELTGATLIENANELPLSNTLKIDEQKYNHLKSEYIQRDNENGKPMWQNIMEAL